MIEAAGVAIQYANKILLLKRSNEGDHAGVFAFAGGKIEDGETPEQAVIREVHEEIGYDIVSPLTEIAHTNDGRVDYTTYVTVAPEAFSPILNDEHDGFAWVTIPEAIETLNLHPAVKKLLVDTLDAQRTPEQIRSDSIETETDIADKIRDGVLASPQKFGNIVLFDMRITGTGTAYRSELGEYVVRNPDYYLNDGFLARCNGLAVIIEHVEPEGDSPMAAALNHGEYQSRNIGSIMLPYIKGDEVWGIAKIYHDDFADLMANEQLSTSPAMIFSAGNKIIPINDETHILVESKPMLLDHLAIVRQGVWDKGSAPSGVKTNHDVLSVTRAQSLADDERSSKGEITMPEVTKEVGATPDVNAAILEALQGIKATVDAVASRVDALESKEDKEVAAVKADDASMPDPALNANLEKPVVKSDDNAVADPKLAAMQATIDSLMANAPAQLKPEEEELFAQAQSKADSAYAAKGKRAPAPLLGQSLAAYKRRMMLDHIGATGEFRADSVHAAGDNHQLLDLMSKSIFADSIARSDSELSAGAPALRATKTTQGGREITKYTGSISAFTAPLKLRSAKGTISLKH